MKIFILFLFFILLIVKIYAIGGADNEEYDADNNEENEVDLTKTCPCDINKDSCDFGCCCDSDCLPYMFDQNYMKLFEECDKSSSFSKNLNNRLDYCDEYQKSLDDLYNPLILAFKILKRGFCPLNDNKKKENDDEEKANQYNIIIDEINRKENENNDQKLPNLDDYKEISDKKFIIDNFNKSQFNLSEFNVPIALPNGMCLFGHFRIPILEHYEVTCTYNINNQKKIIDYYNSTTDSTIDYEIIKHYYYKKLNNIINFQIKKIEIICYDNTTCKIYRYFENSNSDSHFQDLTFEVIFLNNEYDFPRSGNRGYIKGKPLLFNKKDNDPHYIYKILPINYDNNTCNEDPKSNSGEFYFDNYLDNIITFEDFIIFGYSESSQCLNFIDLEENSGIGIFGNANLKIESDWDYNIMKEDFVNNDYSIKLLIGFYRYYGEVSNPQNQIHKLFKNEKVNSGVKYFINKFIKPKKMKTKWEYAPGPGFIRLPKNIMYPFRIGTTKYSEK